VALFHYGALSPLPRTADTRLIQRLFISVHIGQPFWVEANPCAPKISSHAETLIATRNSGLNVSSVNPSNERNIHVTI